MRTDAREAVLKLLYAEIINPSDVETVKKVILKKLTEEEFDFAKQLLDIINAHEETIVSTIDKNIQHFKEDRLFPVDRAVLMIAVAEILYIDDVPSVVSINEAVNLAQKYSTEKSADFVNGVLAGVIQSV